MVARAEAEQLGAGEPNVTEAELLDVLYEVLAQGVPAGQSLTAGDVERFLHEHARAPKSVPAMLAFFSQHNLPLSPSEYGAEAEMRELASGLHRERSAVSMMPASMMPASMMPASMMPLAEEASSYADAQPAPTESGPIRRALPPTDLGAEENVEDSETVRARLAASAPARASRAVWYTMGAVGLLLLAGLAVSFQRSEALSAELSRTRLQQRATDSALTALARSAEGLRGALSQSETERAALAGKFETYASETDKDRAAEGEALKRMLGKRYEVVRAQAQREAAAQLSTAVTP